MNISVKDPKTGKLYNIELRGKDQLLVVKFHTFLGLTGSLFTFTLIALFVRVTNARPYSEETWIALAILTCFTGLRAQRIWKAIGRMIERLIAKYESEDTHV